MISKVQQNEENEGKSYENSGVNILNYNFCWSLNGFFAHKAIKI